MTFNKTFLLVALSLVFGSCTSSKPVPIEEGFLQINGSEVYYKTMGEGEPLVIVHGGPVLDHSYFLPHLESLAQDYKLVFYDQRACGRSSIDVDSESMSLDGFVEDIELLRKELKLDKINLLGHSWGGLLAMKYAIKYDENLNHLILSNSIAPNVSDWQAEGAAVGKKVNPATQKRLDNIVSSGLLRTDDPREHLKEMLKLSYEVQMYDRSNLNKLDLYMPIDFMLRNEVFGLLGPGMSSFDLYADLEYVVTPTLIFYGSAESAVDLHAQKMTNAFADAKLEVIENAGHFPFIEAKQSYLGHISSFLSK